MLEDNSIPEGQPDSRERVDGSVSLEPTSAHDPSDSKSLLAALERIGANTPSAARYRYDGEIAAGGMGIIQRVWDGNLRRAVARKVLGKTGGSSDARHSDPRSVGRFLEEAQVTAQLEHPGIVPVHELGLDAEGKLYFTMRLVRGDDLHQVLKHVKTGAWGWNVTRVLHVLLRVCEAMSFAHKKGVLHRDLKPGNVMVGRFGEVYVMDWGLARVLEEAETKDVRLVSESPSTEVHTDRGSLDHSGPDSPLVTRNGDVVGTPAYMSPEQARGELENIGPASDVYSVGAMLYHLLAGHMPYVEPDQKASAHAVWKWVLEGPPQPVERFAREASPEILAITRRAMSRSLATRYSTMEELAEDLRSYLEQRVVRAYRTGPLVEFRLWVRRNRVTAACLLGLLLALAGGSAGWTWQQTRRRVEAEQRLLERSAAALVRSIDELWPIHPEHAPAMEAWLAEARGVVVALDAARNDLAAFEDAQQGAPTEEDPFAVARRPDPSMLEALAERLAALEALLVFLRTPDPRPGDEDQTRELLHAEHNRAVLERELPLLRRRIAELGTQSASPTWRYQDPLTEREHARLADLASALEALAEPEEGGLATIERRRARALDLEERRRASDWDEALATIADPARCPLYAGLRISPQVGLVPLGRDHASGLFEFWHVLSGDRPARRPEGTLEVTPETGLVLVLVPGGPVTMGAQDSAPDGDNYFAPEEGIHAGLHEAHRWLASVTLAPFFLSKFELTQAQWRRLADANPSTFFSSSSWGDLPRVSELHPVESVSWTDAAQVLWRFGLELPTEAQWERAARAGSQTKYGQGPTWASVRGLANFADRGYARVVRGIDDPALFDDGFVLHAPVDRLAPSRWGFHGLFGNVEEWCRDWYASRCETIELRPGSGEHVPQARADKACRGGSFELDPEWMWASSRLGRSPGSSDRSVGVRPSRALDP